MTKHTYRIGEVASAVGVSVDTLRFYEREKLLPPALRSAGGARRYTEDIVDRVKFIKQPQAVSVTLKDVRVLVDIRQRPTKTGCQKIRAVLANRIQDMQHQIQELREIQIMLCAHLQACDDTLAGTTHVAVPRSVRSSRVLPTGRRDEDCRKDYSNIARG